MVCCLNNRQIGLGSAQKLVKCFPLKKKKHVVFYILFAKCPVPLGLLQTDYVKLFFNEPLLMEYENELSGNEQ